MPNVPVKLGRLCVVRVALETVQGTKVDPPTTELLCYDPKMDPEDNMIVREASGTHGGRDKSGQGPALGKFTTRTELRGNGSSGLDAGLSVLVQGGGMKLTTGVYAPCTAVSDQKTVTIDAWPDGHHRRCYGAMADWELSGEVGQRVMFEPTFSGVLEILADAAMPTPTHTVQPPFYLRDATMTIGGYSPRVGRFSLKPNNPVEPREDTSTAGIGHYLIGPGRGYVIGIDPEDPAAATHDFWANWRNGVEAAFSLVLTDGTVDVTIAAPKVQYLPPKPGLRGSKLTLDWEGQCNKNAGDDELTITVAAHTP